MTADFTIGEGHHSCHDQQYCLCVKWKIIDLKKLVTRITYRSKSDYFAAYNHQITFETLSATLHLVHCVEVEETVFVERVSSPYIGDHVVPRMRRCTEGHQPQGRSQGEATLLLTFPIC